MAASRRARLVAADVGGPCSRILQFESEDDLGFTGGQYVIVQTDVPMGEGKTAKRAYSIVSSDANQRQFQLAVRRIDDGPGSNFMLSLPVGAELAFSGPWGKFLPQQDTSKRVSVVATDTGITAALGLLQSERLKTNRRGLTLTWFVSGDEYFLAESEVRAKLDGLSNEFAVIRIPLEEGEREAWWGRERLSVLTQLQERRPEKVFLSGDGLLLARLRDGLTQDSAVMPEIALETFFHHQAVKQLPAS